MNLSEILEECVKEGREVEYIINKITEEARLDKLALEEEYKKAARESEKMEAVKHKYNDLREDLYEQRKEHIESIPDFWPTAVLNYSRLRKYLTAQDKEIIGFLKSVVVQHDKSECVITFFFGENPFFENPCLRTVYSRTYKGIVHKQGTKISWKDTDTTTGSENEIPVKKGTIHSLAAIKKSFFTRFFDPKHKHIPQKPYGEVLKAIVESLWPRVLGYFLNWSGITAMEVEKGIKRKIALDALQIIQDQLERIIGEEYQESIAVEQEFEKKAREPQVLIQQICNKYLKPLYQKRNEIAKKFPNFWLLAFLSNYALGDLFSEEDQKIFRFVSSMDVEDDEDVVSGYTITLNFFNENPYFTNPSLTKRISFCEDGTTNLSAVNINWKVDMDIATEYKHATSVTNTSFFTWFCAPQVFVGGCRDEVSGLIKNDLWPNVVEYFVNGNESDEEEDEQPKRLPTWSHG